MAQITRKFISDHFGWDAIAPSRNVMKYVFMESQDPLGCEGSLEGISNPTQGRPPETGAQDRVELAFEYL